MKKSVNFSVRLLLKILPNSTLGNFVARCYKLLYNDICSTARIFSSVEILGNIDCFVGHDTFIGPHTFIAGGDSKIVIGRNCDISANVIIISGSHEIGLIGERSAGKCIGKDVIIKDNVWIGFGAKILPGIIVEEGAIIGAGSVVTKNVPSNTIVAGNPAKIIRVRK